jgi:hypothetical protein
VILARTARRSLRIGALAVTLFIASLAMPAALATTKRAVGTLSPSSAPAGATSGSSFTLAPKSGTIGSFLLTAPAGWRITSLDVAPSKVKLWSSTQIKGAGLSITKSNPLTIGFTAQAPCAVSSSTWGIVAKSGSFFGGTTFAIDPASSLNTPLSGTCAATFAEGRSPTDAAFNGGLASENVSNVPFTPGGDPLQAIVTDALGAPRGGIAITLALQCSPPVTCGPGGATLSGPVSAVSDAAGLATFPGSSLTPISIDRTGLGFRLLPTGSGVTGTPSDPFGVYQEGLQCPSDSCSVGGSNPGGTVAASVSADTPSGSLSVLVSDDLDLDCTGSVPHWYSYTPVSPSVVTWLYTGAGSQTIVFFIDKALIQQILDRGASHLDVCYLVEGVDPATGLPKSFKDKFGQTHTTDPGLLPKCGPWIRKNCILSQTGAPDGGRIVTITVEDGRGKI